MDSTCDPATITSDQGSRINGLLKDLLIQTGADFALVVRTEGTLIAETGTVITDEIENVGMLAGPSIITICWKPGIWQDESCKKTAQKKGGKCLPLTV